MEIRRGRAGTGLAVALLATCLIVSGLAGRPAPALARTRAPSVKTVRLASAARAPRGIDVSSFQHPGGAGINWRSVARAGYRFAFIKSTEGTYYVNPYFKTDAAAAEAAGLLVAAYHFANPSRTSGQAQARYALRHGAYRANGRMLRMILDIEPDPYLRRFCYGLSQHQMVTWIAAFMAQARRITGLSPVINTQPGWWKTCTGGSARFSRDQLWVQDPTSRARPRLANGWTHWAYWQYSVTARVPGVSGATDVNKMTPSLLAVADPGHQRGRPGERVRVRVRSINAAVGQVLHYAATGLPSGLRINPATGVITGNLPSGPGTAKTTITVSAAGAAPVTWHFTWTIK